MSILYLKDRVLLPTGKSVITDDQAAQRLFIDGDIPEHVLVDADEQDLHNYRLLYQRDLSVHEEDFAEIPEAVHEHTDEQEQYVLDAIENSSRLKTDEKYMSRLEHEMDYFYRSENIITLYKVAKLVEQFHKDQVVYGVGRGSSVASLVLYYLFAHDIDPLRFGIDFVEFSKDHGE